ncbi:MAG: phosphotransferase, partial [Solirubrobacterales bacterium]|nr:phosphotransferase [Solirubrobacterales bacterium]
MPTPIAPDDIVLTHAEGEANEREPLVVLEPLAQFLDENGIAAGAGLPKLESIGDGHSNITYRLTRGERQVVLRRPPRGPLPPTAHNVLREARLLKALEGTAARTPKVYAACDDHAVIGSDFYVMECVDGDVIVDSVPEVLSDPAEHRRISEELVDALVEV